MKKIFLAFFFGVSVPTASMASEPSCKDLPDYDQVKKALSHTVQDGNGGLFKPNLMWVAIVNRGGQVCSVVKTGDAWPGSRIIAAQKANTANSFSNDHLALSTANLFSAVQPGGSLFGLQESNPVNPAVAYHGSAKDFGTKKDPLVGARLGGVNVFGGGVALYAKDGKTVIGGLGVSGDSSCSDHIIAWKMRQELGFNQVPGGVSPNKDDNIIHDIDITTGRSAGGYGHPICSQQAKDLALALKIKTH